METFNRLQFQRLPIDAQRAALWRLALRGHTQEQIAERTGWTVEQVRQRMESAAIEEMTAPTWYSRAREASLGSRAA